MQSPYLAQLDVPTEGTGNRRYGKANLRLRKGTPTPLMQGHSLDPHRVMSVEWRAFVKGVTGTWKTAEMVLRAAELQARNGACFASARHLASAAYGQHGMANEKTWDRTIAKLRAQGMAETHRLVRPGGLLGTNIVDLSELWHLFLDAAKHMRVVLFRLGGNLMALPRAWSEWWETERGLVLGDPGGFAGEGVT